MRPSIDTAATRCSEAAKRVLLKSIKPDDESSTFFNLFDNVETDIDKRCSLCCGSTKEYKQNKQTNWTTKVSVGQTNAI